MDALSHNAAVRLMRPGTAGRVASGVQAGWDMAGSNSEQTQSFCISEFCTPSVTNAIPLL
jgi:hypothetical protein